ncbi:hypothetical protein KQI52_03260 [bacterium]|nr:hypothetical protein [bacterium]
MKRRWISVSAIWVVLVVTMGFVAGCNGGSSDQAENAEAGLLGDASMFFIGDTTHNEFPSSSVALDGNVAVLLRERPVDRSSGQPSILKLQMRDPQSELIWSLPLTDPRENVTDMKVIDGRGLLLIGKLGENVLESTLIREFSPEDGSTVSDMDTHWDPHFSPWSMNQLANGNLLVLGGRVVEAGQPFEAYGVILDADGNKVGEWDNPATHLFPTDNGFLGVQRVPGGRYPDQTLYGLSETGELTWTIERADTLIGGVVMGALTASDGDILVVGDDRTTRQPVYVRIGAEDGEVRWIKRNPETLGYTCYNPMRLAENRIFIPCSKMQIDEANQQQPWSSIGGLIIDENAQMLDSSLLMDFWMIPTMPAVELGPGKVLMIGIANVDPVTFPRITDAGWLLAEVK